MQSHTHTHTVFESTMSTMCIIKYDDISMSQQRHLLSVTDIQNTRAILVLREYNMDDKQNFASLLVRIKFSSEYLPFQSKETHCLRYNSCLTSTHTHKEWRIRLFHFGHMLSYFSSHLLILSSFFTIDCWMTAWKCLHSSKTNTTFYHAVSFWFKNVHRIHARQERTA